MQNGTWATVAVCGLLGGCADLALLLRPSPAVTLSAVETVVEGATDLQGGTVRTRSTRKMVQPPKPVLAEKQPSQTTVDAPAPTIGATGSTSITSDEAVAPAQRAQDAQRAEAQRAQEELIAQRDRAAKRALSGICTGC
jgi:hypothetical protein